MNKLILITLVALSACATVNGVPQTPCERAQRAADVAHDAVTAAVHAGLDPVIVAKLNDAATVASVAAGVACAVIAPAPTS